MKLSFNTQRATADPFIFRWENRFYLYVTGSKGVEAYSAASVAGEWSHEGVVCSREGGVQYWAPSVIYHKGRFWLYTSCNHEERFEHMFSASAASPLGPFVPEDFLYDRFSIDSHVVETEAGLFMFYAEDNTKCDKIGTRIFVDKLDAPNRAAGICRELLTPTHKEEMFRANRFGDGKDWYTLEGPFWFQEGEWQYLMFSGACFENDTYHIGYATAKTREQDLTKVTFKKHTAADGSFDPLMIRNSVEEGVGHHSVLCLDGHYYIIYHGRDIGASGKGDLRTARIARLYPEDGLLRVELLPEGSTIE